MRQQSIQVRWFAMATVWLLLWAGSSARAQTAPDPVADQVHVTLGASKGQGYVKRHRGACYVITPEHVVMDVGPAGPMLRPGEIAITGHARARGVAAYDETILDDVAVLRVTSGAQTLCAPNTDRTGIGRTGQVLVYRTSNGDPRRLRTDRAGADGADLLVEILGLNARIRQGLSGGAYVIDGQRWGMLLRLQEATGFGVVIAQGNIDRAFVQFYDQDRGDQIIFDPPPPSRTPGTVFRDCETCPEMVVLPVGRFRRGALVSETGSEDNERPVRYVRFREPIAVGRFEITRGQFAQFVDATGYEVGANC